MGILGTSIGETGIGIESGMDRLLRSRQALIDGIKIMPKMMRPTDAFIDAPNSMFGRWP
jgi:hypothetical protein